MRKRYHAPVTPCQRLLDDPRTSDVTRALLRELLADLDPVLQLRNIRTAQQRLVTLADATSPWAIIGELPVTPLDAFLSSLRTAWQNVSLEPVRHWSSREWQQRPRPGLSVSSDTGSMIGEF